MTVPLRDYQQEAVGAVRRAYVDGVRRQLVALPTGTGKTVVFGSLVDSARSRSGWQSLILAHRDELIQQAVDKVLQINPDLALDVGVVKAERNEWDKPIVVASVQSLHARRLSRLPAGQFDLGVVDEAHHSVADTYQAILRHFGFLDETTNRLLLGVTATPERADAKALGDVWQRVVYQRTILDMIAAGWLCDLGGKAVRVEGLDLDRVESSHGDWQDGDLGDARETANAPEQAVEAWIEHAKDRPTIAFTPTIRLSELMAEAFQGAGVPAEHLDGSTPTDERRAIIGRLRSGETRVITNCGVLTEGFDEPTVACILMARPTRSKVLYVQCVGRGTRKHASKADVQTEPGDDVWRPGCLVLDLAGAATKHTLISVPRLVAGQGIDEQVMGMMDEEGLSVVEAIGRQDELVASGRLVARQIDLFRQRKARWRQADAQVWTLAGRLIVAQAPDATWRVIEKQRDQPLRVVADGLTLEYAQGAAETEARRLDLGALVDPKAPWRREPASDGQRRALYRFGKRKLSREPGLTKGQAGDELDVLVALAEDRP